MRSLIKDNSGVAVIVTAIVLIAIILTALAAVRLNYVPAECKRLETEHYYQASSSWIKIKNFIDTFTISQAASGTSIYWPVPLGYQKTVFLGTDTVFAGIQYLSGFSEKIYYGKIVKGSIVWQIEYSGTGSIRYSAEYMYYPNAQIYFEGDSLVLYQNGVYTILTPPTFSIDPYTKSMVTNVVSVYAGKNVNTAGLGTAILDFKVLYTLEQQYSIVNGVVMYQINTTHPTVYSNYLENYLKSLKYVQVPSLTSFISNATLGYEVFYVNLTSSGVTIYVSGIDSATIYGISVNFQVYASPQISRSA